MKTVAFFVVFSVAALAGTSALAQNNSPSGPAPAPDMSSSRLGMSKPGPAGQWSSERVPVSGLLRQDIRALKKVKQQLKDAKTDEERAALLDEKRQIEQHMAELIRS